MSYQGRVSSHVETREAELRQEEIMLMLRTLVDESDSELGTLAPTAESAAREERSPEPARRR